MKPSEAGRKPPNMRGWGKFKIGSTRLSTVGKFRETITKYCLLYDKTKCMYEFTLRFPPKKKKVRHV